MSEYRLVAPAEFDLANADEVRAVFRAVLRERDCDVLVDCSRLRFIDSSGLHVLLEANRLLEANGRHMLVVNVRPSARRVFELLGVDDLLRYDRSAPLPAA